MSSRVLTEFDLLFPHSLSEAWKILNQHGDRVTTIAGGTDTLVAMKAGYNTPYAMSLSRLPDLDYLTFDPEEGLRVGARATIAQLLDSSVVKECYPALWQAAKVFATPQLKNVATVLGNMLRASPAGDCSCAIYALGGKVLLKSESGQRRVNVDDFWTGYSQTARQPNELAVELQLSPPATNRLSAFKRLTRVNEDLAKLNIAVSLTMDGDTCTDLRLVMGCVGPTLLRLHKTEDQLRGKVLDKHALQAAIATVAEEITPIDDKRSTGAYRRKVAGVYLKRTIEQALECSEQ